MTTAVPLNGRTMLKRLGALGLTAPLATVFACANESRVSRLQPTARPKVTAAVGSMDHSAPLSGGSTIAQGAQAPVALEFMPVPEMAPPITRTSPADVSIQLEAADVRARLADGVGYDFWTFNGTVPGPMLRVRQDDTVTLRLTNKLGNNAGHNIDLHAVTVPVEAPRCRTWAWVRRRRSGSGRHTPVSTSITARPRRFRCIFRTGCTA